MYYIHLISGENSATSSGDHQALLSLPSTPRRDILRSQVEIAIPDSQKLEMSVKCSGNHHQSTERSVQQVHLSKEDVCRKADANQQNVVPETSSSSTFSTFTLKTHEILNRFDQSYGQENSPLISSDVAVQLLKIQSSKLKELNMRFLALN